MCPGLPSHRESSHSLGLEAAAPHHSNAAIASGAADNSEAAWLRQQIAQLQAQQAQHEEEVEQLRQEHTAQLAAVQAQAVSKMKELIEKVWTIASLNAW